MRRREFIAALGGAAAWPVLANALDAASPVVGFLIGAGFKAPVMQSFWAAFLEGLASLGYIEGQNLRIELREADGQYERLPGLAAGSGVIAATCASRPHLIASTTTFNVGLAGLDADWGLARA